MYCSVLYNLVYFVMCIYLFVLTKSDWCRGGKHVRGESWCLQGHNIWCILRLTSFLFTAVEGGAGEGKGGRNTRENRVLDVRVYIFLFSFWYNFLSSDIFASWVLCANRF